MVVKAMSTSAGPSAGPIHALLTAKLLKAFNPTHLELENESYKHSVPPGSESHFKLFIVSHKFEGQPILARHRAINDALRDDSTGELPVHALSIQAKTPQQWAAGATMQGTPGCLGGGTRH